MLIEGFGIAGYRSFRELQRISPCSKVNLIVGQNNSGKSNVLLFLKSHYKAVVEAIRGGGSFSFKSLDRHIGASNPEATFAFSMPFSGNAFDELLSSLPDERMRQLATAVVKSSSLSEGNSAAWFRFQRVRSGFHLDQTLIEALSKEHPISNTDWYDLWHTLTKLSHGDLNAHWIPETLSNIYSRLLVAPKVTLIPAIRRIDKGPNDEDDHSGLGLIEKLAKLQNPSITERHLRQRFDNINRFLQSVLGDSSAEIEVPNDRDMILVHMNDRTLPLSSLGTGIHEVTILAAAATAISNEVICIEELELHLHPLLQRKLIRYLQDNTDNQYFITTHSAHLLDTPGATVFHTRLQDGATTIERIESPAAKSRVCVDLGYRASDLVQANCVIWVEGPSDRIYLNHWIKTADPALVEGVHYSIMFYGGRLLSHLSANDPEVTEFISLRRLNRYISVVIDSDRAKARGVLNETKRRVRDEFDEGPGFAWITKGREIENYLPAEIVAKAVTAVHSGVAGLISTDQFSNILQYRRTSERKIQTADKVKVAHEVVKEPPDLNVLDLRKQIEKTVAFIREANVV
jgi:predicted ATP-dependent endonuclease of OLD family